MFNFVARKCYPFTQYIRHEFRVDSFSQATRPLWPAYCQPRSYGTRHANVHDDQPEREIQKTYTPPLGTDISDAIKAHLNDDSKVDEYTRLNRHAGRLAARQERKVERRSKLRENHPLQRMSKREKVLKVNSLMENFDKHEVSDPAFKPGSKDHHDLTSFMEYAVRVDLDQSSSVFIGTRYEYVVAEALKQHQFNLLRVGRRGDAGVDLIGRWTVPSSKKPLNVFIQCKSGKGINGSHVRSLKGAFIGLPLHIQKGLLGLLAITGQPTAGVRMDIDKSTHPLGLLKITPEGKVEQFYWNQAAVSNGLRDMGVGVKYGSRFGTFTSAKDQEVGVIFGGWPVGTIVPDKKKEADEDGSSVGLNGSQRREASKLQERRKKKVDETSD